MRTYIWDQDESIWGSSGEEKFVLCIAEKSRSHSFDYFVECCFQHMCTSQVPFRKCEAARFWEQLKGNLASQKDVLEVEVEELLRCVEIDPDVNPDSWSEKAFFAETATRYIGFNWSTSA